MSRTKRYRFVIAYEAHYDQLEYTVVNLTSLNCTAPCSVSSLTGQDQRNNFRSYRTEITPYVCHQVQSDNDIKEFFVLNKYQ